MKPHAEQKLIQFFKGKADFSREELFDYFQREEGVLNENTFGWRIYDLKKKDILQEKGRGRYTFLKKPVYVPPVDGQVSRLAAIFHENFKDISYCTWNISWLNEFTVHQFTVEYHLFETEKDLLESFGHHLLAQGYQNIVLPAYARPQFNIFNTNDPVVLCPLITRAPVQKTNGEKRNSLYLPTLEKILVDIYQNDFLFHFIQGAEMERIFEAALSRYAINYTKLFSYAKRRGKEVELRDFLLKQFTSIV